MERDFDEMKKMHNKNLEKMYKIYKDNDFDLLKQ